MKKIAVFIILLIFMCLSGCITLRDINDAMEQAGETTYTSNITNGDFRLSSDNPSSNVLKVTIIPDVDIDNLVINMELVDEDENVLGIDVAKKEKAYKDEKYEFIFDANECLSGKKLKQFKYFKYTVTGTKTVVLKKGQQIMQVT